MASRYMWLPSTLGMYQRMGRTSSFARALRSLQRSSRSTSVSFRRPPWLLSRSARPSVTHAISDPHFLQFAGAGSWAETAVARIRARAAARGSMRGLLSRGDDTPLRRPGLTLPPEPRARFFERLALGRGKAVEAAAVHLVEQFIDLRAKLRLLGVAT